MDDYRYGHHIVAHPGRPFHPVPRTHHDDPGVGADHRHDRRDFAVGHRVDRRGPARRNLDRLAGDDRGPWRDLGLRRRRDRSIRQRGDGGDDRLGGHGGLDQPAGRLPGAF